MHKRHSNLLTGRTELYEGSAVDNAGKLWELRCWLVWVSAAHQQTAGPAFNLISFPWDPPLTASTWMNRSSSVHVGVCACKRQKDGERATEYADHVRSSERREWRHYQPIRCEGMSPAVGLGLRVVLTCNDRWMEGGRQGGREQRERVRLILAHI